MTASDLGEVVALYSEFGVHYYDEDVSQLDHALQTAALARFDGASEALVAAALLHDVGHLLHLAGCLGSEAASCGPTDKVDLKHENTGARYLTGIFPAAVTGPIALHVRAKQYLCAVEPDYLRGLSSGSVLSLAKQGGAMTHEEALAFEANPLSSDAVRLRRWDDMGKVESLDTPGLDSYLESLRRLAS